jgi:hypothetical protein
LFIVAINTERRAEKEMSEEGDTFWVSLSEKLLGVVVVAIGALMLYLTATSTNVLGAFSLFFGIISLIMLIIGLFLLLVRPPQ